MRSTLSAICCLVAAMACSTAQADLVVVDYTGPGPGDSGTAIFTGTTATFTLDDFDFGGERTADITLSTAGTTLGAIAAGIGVNDGTQGGRIGLNEDITVTFSDFMGDTAPGVSFSATDITFQGFVASTLASSGAFSIEGGDVFSINGAALTANNAGDGAAPTLTFSADDFVFQNLDAGGTVALNGSDALVLDLTTDAGGGYRLQGLALDVTAVSAVPEPSSLALLGLGCVGMLILRRK